MPKRYYVDYENVRVEGLKGLEDLTSSDVVNILYTTNADSMTFGMHARLDAAKAQINLIKVACGSPQALDFQLASLLGYDIKEFGNNVQYRIVSKDTGYRVLSSFWKSRRNSNVALVRDLASGEALSLQEEVARLTGDLLSAKDDCKVIADFIAKYKTKQGLNTALQKRFGSKACGPIYQAIKPLLAEKK